MAVILCFYSITHIRNRSPHLQWILSVIPSHLNCIPHVCITLDFVTIIPHNYSSHF